MPKSFLFFLFFFNCSCWLQHNGLQHRLIKSGFPPRNESLNNLKILVGGKLCVEFKGGWEWGPSDKEERLEDINSNT